jgi:hypothetical protein
MLAPGSTISVTASTAANRSAVPSVDPPSTMTTSSGARVCAASDARKASTPSAQSFTVEISVTFIEPPRPVGTHRA